MAHRNVYMLKCYPLTGAPVACPGPWRTAFAAVPPWALARPTRFWRAVWLGGKMCTELLSSSSGGLAPCKMSECTDMYARR